MSGRFLVPLAAVGFIAFTAVGGLPSESRMAWLDSTVGEDGTVTRPFLPVSVDEASRTVRILGRELVLGAEGLPARYAGFFSSVPYEIVSTRRDYLTGPISFSGLDATNAVFRFTEKTPVRASWIGTSVCGAFAYVVEGSLEYDGYAKFVVTVQNRSATRQSFEAALRMPVSKSCSRYVMGLGHRGGERRGGFSWTWDEKLNQDALWLGDVGLGAMLRLGGRARKRPLINCYYKWKPLELPDCWRRGGVVVAERADGAVLLTASGGRFKLDPGERNEWGFELFLTPFKPIDFGRHFADRYYHPTQPTSRIDLPAVRKAGANVINLHHNTLWNPYINYPYNEDGGPLLKRFIAEAHREGFRVKVYYTTREITQNMPEFARLNALGDEIIFKRDGRVEGWPITNGSGPHPQLAALAGDAILPAWREKVSFPEAYPPRNDLSVITNPDSRRWCNFYLSGLDLLVRDYGIDGLYVDDTALDRVAMRRARRILDGDGRQDRLVDMHSWSHFNEHCGWIPSDVAYLELYPYLDRIWHGEDFTDDLPPDVWLIERSGFAWGLAGEMLGRGNPFRGLLFGQTDRLGWGGKPEGTWRFFDDVDMGSMRPYGWWESEPQVVVEGDGADVKATLWRGGRTDVLVLANWSAGEKTVSFRVRGHEGGVWRVPAIADVQEAGTDWSEGEAGRLAGNGGAVLIRETGGACK